MKLADYLPDKLRDPVIIAFLDSFSDVFSDLGIVREIDIQISPSTATWGLDFWENAYGIDTDLTKSIESRRSEVISKIRGFGISTKARIENIAESFEYGDVDVIEDFSNYAVEIKFISSFGIPPNLEDIERAISEALPCHLATVFTFKFVVWADLANLTWAQLEEFTWGEIAERLPA